jgi:hypothetical protein
MLLKNVFKERYGFAPPPGLLYWKRFTQLYGVSRIANPCSLNARLLKVSLKVNYEHYMHTKLNQ